jgi:glycosyltransferase involved in cell wall biosynthesis
MISLILETFEFIHECTNYILKKMLSYPNINKIYVLSYDILEKKFIHPRVIYIDIANFDYDYKKLVIYKQELFDDICIYLRFSNILTLDVFEKVIDKFSDLNADVLYIKSVKLFIDNKHLVDELFRTEIIIFKKTIKVNNDNQDIKIIYFNDYCGYILENCFKSTSIAFLFFDQYINTIKSTPMSFNTFYEQIKLCNCTCAANNYFNQTIKLIPYLNCDPIINLDDLKYIFNENKLSYKKNLNRNLVSVIITVYNKEDYLESSINSILRQSYTNIEIIIIDDCSIDNSKEILNKFLDHPKIKIYYNDKNLGCYRSRNIAISNSTGKYICFHDADDYSLKTRIKKQIKQFDACSTLLVCGTNMMRSLLPNINYSNDDDLINDIKKIKSQPMPYNIQIGMFGLPTLMIKKKVFDKYGLYIEKRKCMDLEYLERIFFYEKNIIFKDNLSWDYFNTFNNDIFCKLNNLLYFSPKMNSSNITNLEPEDDFIKKKLWRQNFLKIKN